MLERGWNSYLRKCIKRRGKMVVDNDNGLQLCGMLAR